MVSTLFTALALIATGQVRLQPAPPNHAPTPLKRAHHDGPRRDG